MASKQWKDWPHQDCPVCGSGTKIESELPGNWAICGDRWRCEEGHEGGVYCDSETPVQLDEPLAPTPATTEGEDHA